MAQPIWNTDIGLIGSFPSLISMSFIFSASAQTPATYVTYQLLSGAFPNGVTLNSITGILSGIPELVDRNTEYGFTLRVTDNLGNIRDRTFLMNISGSAIPQFVTPNGSILSTQDSIWIYLPIAYSNPDINNPAIISIKQGALPPGLEIDALGVIRGYAKPPVVTTTTSALSTLGVLTSSVQNEITVNSTIGFSIGRPIIFSGSVIGGLVANQIYYVKSIASPTVFSVASTQNGSTVTLTDASGTMSVTLPAVSTGQPTIRTYNFTLEITSPLGNDVGNYSITVINQNVPVSQGGPGKPLNTRLPVILNTRPLTYNLNNSDPYFGYYILPPIPPTQNAQMGNFQSGNFFAFKIIGDDFDGNPIAYSYSDLPNGLTGDTTTGWITGSITLATQGISNYNFRVSAYKLDNPVYASAYFNFSFYIENQITSVITWLTDSNFGTFLNGSVSNLSVVTQSDVDISYRLISGTIPPNLTLTTGGELVGKIADQPTDTYLSQGDTSTFEFTIQAYSILYPSITSTKTFTISVYQEFAYPVDTLYIKAAPPINDRIILDSLLYNDTIIPPEAIYRPNDIYFGKAKSVIYEHAYGIYASDIQQYIAAIQIKNHYWRNITLGQINTAVARDENGNIIYEVVYSSVIDNLVNPYGVSVNTPINWPRPIDLGLGPWYTSITDIYTSYDYVLGTYYYTSLTPGNADVLYPNSLYNMRNQVADVLGQDLNSKVLPAWMTSQQVNGSTLGYTPAWVICYTKPGYAETVKTNIETLWPYTLNIINFEIDRFSVDKSMTYDFNNLTTPAFWTGLPSATPAPDPIDSKDFYVLFPRKTILPDQSQY